MSDAGYITSGKSFDFHLFRYKAIVKSMYDADTVTLIVDLGFGTFREMRFRLYGIDAWEVRGEEKVKGRAARDWLRNELPGGSEVFIESIKDKTGKYGRYLASLYVDHGGLYIDLNAELVAQGHAEFKDY